MTAKIEVAGFGWRFVTWYDGIVEEITTFAPSQSRTDFELLMSLFSVLENKDYFVLGWEQSGNISLL